MFFDPVRLSELFKSGKQNYAEMLVRKRAELTTKDKEDTPSTSAMTVPRDTSERDDALAEQMDLLATLSTGF